MRKQTIVMLAAVLAAATACDDSPVARSGAPVDPVTLQSEWGQDAGGVGGDVLTALIHGTGRGPVTVLEGDGRVGEVPSDNEIDALQTLMAGDADITVVRAGALQELGATSLAPLTAPFVVTNDDQAQAIAADPAIRDAVLAGLDGMGLVGLAIVPGGLRHPFAYGDKPILGAEDYEGQTINVRRDAGVQAILDGLGARPDYSVDSERSARVTSGELRGIEIQVQQLGAVSLPAVQTANVSLYEKFDIVLVRKAAWEGLSGPQRDALQQSVDNAASDALADRPTESQGQMGWCLTTGAATVLASAGQLATLRTKLDAVTDALAEDPAHDAVIQRMRDLHDGTADPTAGACTGPAPAEPRSAYIVKPKGDQRLFDGTWRVSSTEQELIDRGVSAHDAQLNAGVWEFRLDNGYADGIQPDGRPCNGSYAINGREFSMDWGVNGIEDCNGLMRGTWRLDGDRLYLMAEKEWEYDVLLDQAMFGHGMVRVE